jgi:hypothetical protein
MVKMILNAPAPLMIPKINKLCSALMTMQNPKHVSDACIYQARCGLFKVFHFTGAHKSDILANIVQTLIDAPPTLFHCNQYFYSDVKTNLQTDLIGFERVEHT